MDKLKTWHFFVVSIICFISQYFIIYFGSGSKIEGIFFITSILIGLVSLIIAFVYLSKGKIPKGKKIICPYCKGQAREYRSIVIKILYPILFLTPKYICMDCKKLFNTPYEEEKEIFEKQKREPEIIKQNENSSTFNENLQTSTALLFGIVAILIIFIPNGLPVSIILVIIAARYLLKAKKMNENKKYINITYVIVYTPVLIWIISSINHALIMLYTNSF